MKVERTNLEDCWILEPDVFEDQRGYFYEGFNVERFKKYTGINFDVKQINQSKSSKGVLRGLHFQKNPKAQAKLVSCISGEVLDVAVDLRKGSPTYGKYEMVLLTEDNKKQFYIPKGMAHGFLVISEYAKLMYQVDELYSKEHDSGIIYNDKDIGIDWRYSTDQILLSDKDQNLPTLKQAYLNF